MKWSIGLLIVVGLVAAGAVGLLVMFMARTQRPTTVAKPAEITVLLAKKDLPAMSVVGTNDVETKVMPSNTAPLKAMTDSPQVVGKVLVVPVKEGQAFTEDLFAGKNSPASLAAAIPAGMRAMSVSLSDYEALLGQLYPGSVVDVLFSFRGTGGPQPNETISMTLLRGIQVLAIEDKSVVSSGEESPLSTGGRGGRKVMVTLMVKPKQAELLQLAQEHGMISLTMRNPLDNTPVSSDETETLLSQLSRQFQKPGTPGAAAANGQYVQPKPTVGRAPETDQSGRWNVTVIHGSAVEVLSFPLPAESGK